MKYIKTPEGHYRPIEDPETPAPSKAPAKPEQTKAEPPKEEKKGGKK